MKQQNMITALNKHLSNLHVMNVKLHNYHWNVKGSQFFGAHELTQKYYEHFFELYDDVAERILQIGGTPFSTVSEYLENASIKEEKRTDFSVEDVLKGVRADFETFLAEARSLNALAKEGDDIGTENMTVEFIAWLEKAIWMLNHTLKK